MIISVRDKKKNKFTDCNGSLTARPGGRVGAAGAASPLAKPVTPPGYEPKGHTQGRAAHPVGGLCEPRGERGGPGKSELLASAAGHGRSRPPDGRTQDSTVTDRVRSCTAVALFRR